MKEVGIIQIIIFYMFCLLLGFLTSLTLWGILGSLILLCLVFLIIGCSESQIISLKKELEKEKEKNNNNG